MLDFITSNDLTVKAREGDVDSQKRLFEECKRISLPICLQQVRNISNLNIDYEDLRDLVTPAFLRALTTYKINKLDFYNYFKFIYMQEIKTLIRKTVIYNAKNDQFDDEIEKIKNQNFNCYINDDIYSKYSLYDIEKIKEIIYENKMQLTKKEKQLMTLFLNGLNIREISYYLKNNYTETARTIKKAILKIKKYCNT